MELAFSLAEAYQKYMIMKEDSRRIPRPLIVTARKFSHLYLTTGNPYQVQRRQLNSAMMYGRHEKFLCDFLPYDPCES